MARIGKGESDPTASKIDELIVEGQIGLGEFFHLSYFLSALTELGANQVDREAAIQGFIRTVNQYWDTASREKEFRYDKYKVKVEIWNKITNKPLHFHHLSSGEKQIISVFSRLFFGNAKEYFVIIDEPELSLSIEWQKLFLPDIAKSPKCSGLLAITHSPFTYDNALEPYASSLITDSWGSYD